MNKYFPLFFDILASILCPARSRSASGLDGGGYIIRHETLKSAMVVIARHLV